MLDRFATLSKYFLRRRFAEVALRVPSGPFGHASTVIETARYAMGHKHSNLIIITTTRKRLASAVFVSVQMYRLHPATLPALLNPPDGATMKTPVGFLLNRP